MCDNNLEFCPECGSEMETEEDYSQCSNPACRLLEDFYDDVSDDELEDE